MLQKIALLLRRAKTPLKIHPRPPDRCLPDDALKAVLVPLDDLRGVDLVGSANLVLAAATAGDALTGTGPWDVVSKSRDNPGTHASLT